MAVTAPSLFWADLEDRLKEPEFRRAYIAAAIRFEITDRVDGLPDKLREKATSLGLALLCEAAFEGKATAADAEALAVIVMDLLALGGELDTRAEQAEAAIERVRRALHDGDYGGPERGDVIAEIRAALDQPEGGQA